MAVPEGVRSANPNAKSLFERFAEASSEVTRSRLLVWGCVVVTASLIAAIALPRHLLDNLRIILTLAPVLGMFVAFGGTTYFLARFVLTWEVCHLLSSTAFSTIGVGMAPVAANAIGSDYLSFTGLLSAIVWAVSGLLFASSAHFRVTCSAPSRGRALTQSILASAIVMLPLFVIVSCWINGTLHVATFNDDHLSLAKVIMNTSAVVLYSFALRGFYRRTHLEQDRMSGLLCYALIPLVTGLFFQIGSAQVLYKMSVISAMLTTLSWMVLVGGFGIENAVMQRDAKDRLQELNALDQVSWSIVGAGSVRDLLDMFAQTHREQLGAKIAAVYLADETEENLELFAICGPIDSLEEVGTMYPMYSTNHRPGFHSGHTVKAFLTKEIQVANDVFVDVEFVPWKLIASDDGCAASLPLVTGGKAIGVVNLYFEDCRYLTKQRLRLLATIATSVAPAIASARQREIAEESSSLLSNLDRAA